LTIPAPETKAAEPADVAESFYIPANGDTTALRLCMERILPTRKDRPVSFDMPRIETVADSVKAAAASDCCRKFNFLSKPVCAHWVPVVEVFIYV
jgi:hypothetical protein